MSNTKKKGYGHHEFLNRFIRKNEAGRILEIGVDDGSNAKTMVETARENLPPEKIEYFGFDTFEDKSKYGRAREKLNDSGCHFELYRGNSVETLPKATENLPDMDLIFIDGGHDYETVKSDWKNSKKKLMKEGTVVFFHNYGRSGTKRVVEKISREKFSVEVLKPEGDYPTAKVKKV